MSNYFLSEETYRGLKNLLGKHSETSGGASMSPLASAGKLPTWILVTGAEDDGWYPCTAVAWNTVAQDWTEYADGFASGGNGETLEVDTYYLGVRSGRRAPGATGDPEPAEFVVTAPASGGGTIDIVTGPTVGGTLIPVVGGAGTWVDTATVTLTEGTWLFQINPYAQFYQTSISIYNYCTLQAKLYSVDYSADTLVGTGVGGMVDGYSFWCSPLCGQLTTVTGGGDYKIKQRVNKQGTPNLIYADANIGSYSFLKLA